MERVLTNETASVHKTPGSTGIAIVHGDTEIRLKTIANDRDRFIPANGTVLCRPYVKITGTP